MVVAHWNHPSKGSWTPEMNERLLPNVTGHQLPQTDWSPGEAETSTSHTAMSQTVCYGPLSRNRYECWFLGTHFCLRFTIRRLGIGLFSVVWGGGDLVLGFVEPQDTGIGCSCNKNPAPTQAPSPSHQDQAE